VYAGSVPSVQPAGPTAFSLLTATGVLNRARDLAVRTARFSPSKQNRSRKRVSSYCVIMKCMFSLLLFAYFVSFVT
jgi:hypothetical protein